MLNTDMYIFVDISKTDVYWTEPLNSFKITHIHRRSTKSETKKKHLLKTCNPSYTK